MSDIIRNDQVVADDWQILQAGEGLALEMPLPEGRVVVPMEFWIAHHAALIARGNVAVWLAGHEEVAGLTPWLAQLPLIAVHFPKFADGRGFSAAFLLRSRLGYQGELRAVGDVLPDQLFFMWRVGFNAFAVRQDKDIHKALQCLKPFSEAYQGSWDNAAPAYRRHRRDWPAGQHRH